MAYSNETSSVKTIVPGAEVSGFCDVVARHKINELSGEVPQLSAGEGIAVTTVDGKTVITNNISAGSNISLVYDQETNTYRIDNTGAGAQVVSALGTNSGYMSNPTIIVKGAGSWGLDGYGANVSFSSDGGSKRGGWLVPDGSAAGSTTGNGNAILGWNTTFKEPAWRNLSTINVTSLGDGTNYYKKTETSSKQELSDAIDYVSANAGHTYTGIAPIQVDNVNNQISITGESLSAGPGIDMFSSGGYVVISSNGGNPFPITGTNGTTGFTANMDCSSMMLTTGASPAGGYVRQTAGAVYYEAYPATDVSASWYNIINGANNKSNCYCIRFTNDMTAASLEDYSAYDKVSVVHSYQYTPNCMLYWNGNTKVFPSGLYCELVKGTNDQNQTDWFFTTSGWINNVEWDYD